MYFFSFSIFGAQLRAHHNHDDDDGTPTLEYISNIVRRAFSTSESHHQENVRDRQLTIEDLNNNTSLLLNQDCESQENCPICVDGMKLHQILRTIKRCNHTFHQSCIDNWFVRNNTCPVCRDTINRPCSRNNNDNQQPLHPQPPQQQRQPNQQQEASPSLFRFPIQFEFDL